ncbi:hypothetical protein TEQG_07673 [Trichophyton equinum CBS 127.97]|uniref:Secreted protein n=1 Tax=Trichophyton equinum (strain ATCC MYA-4606 / CBS 127.97) TaxID=559882 RepID=F2Q3J6_TRIEC|nr:hypothetical protein TEQG_07673 [Trichophyton equinum CBS 127.97]
MDARSVSYLLLSMMICWRGCVPRFTVAERCREPPRMQTRYRRVGLSEAQEQLKGPIGLNCVIILSYHPPFPPPFAGGRKFVIILRSVMWCEVTSSPQAGSACLTSLQAKSQPQGTSRDVMQNGRKETGQPLPGRSWELKNPG